MSKERIGTVEHKLRALAVAVTVTSAGALALVGCSSGDKTPTVTSTTIASPDRTPSTGGALNVPTTEAQKLNLPTTTAGNQLSVPTTVTPETLDIPTTQPKKVDVPTTVTPDTLSVPTTTEQKVEVTTTSAKVIHKLVFDALGGGSTIISVFPGVGDNEADRVRNGTFRFGDSVVADCQTEGRFVQSDPSVGEIARSSDKWIKIEGSPGMTQYATAVYIQNPDQLLSQLPEC